jgi:hypothetical protein
MIWNESERTVGDSDRDRKDGIANIFLTERGKRIKLGPRKKDLPDLSSDTQINTRREYENKILA